MTKMADHPVYLFLDFDGVLHPSWLGETFEQADHLGRVVFDSPEVRIVVTSSWRKKYDLDQLRTMCGPLLGPRIISTTPLMLINEQLGAVKPADWRVRHEEIALWLEINAPTGREGSDPEGNAAIASSRVDWLALDDSAEFFPDPCPQLVVSHEDGLYPRQPRRSANAAGRVA